MNQAYRNFLASAGAAAVSYVGLVDESGDELSGGSPAYARQAVSWRAPVNGLIRLEADVTFDIPGGATVAGWRGYSASVSGVDYDGAALPSEVFASQGQYTLLATSTGIAHNAA